MSGPILQQVVIEDFNALRLARSVVDGIKSRLKSLFSSAREAPAEAVRRFYETARGNEPDHDIIDMSQGTYRGFLDRLRQDLAIYLSPEARVLDLGCGDLTFLHHLRKAGEPPADYLGIDILPPGKVASRMLTSRWLFECGDIEHIELDVPFRPNLVIACNSLCYLEDPSHLLRRAASNLAESGSLVIIEPSPSLFWESYFNGVHLHLRSRGTHNSVLEGCSLTHRGDYVLYAQRIRNWPFWPIAYLSLFSK